MKQILLILFLMVNVIQQLHFKHPLSHLASSSHFLHLLISSCGINNKIPEYSTLPISNGLKKTTLNDIYTKKNFIC